MILTAHAKQLVAAAMYRKGKAFVGAAMLVRTYGGDEYVVLHLICQGIELVLKAILLAIDYDKYCSRLKHLGHDLLKTAREVVTVVGATPLKPILTTELKELANLYQQHVLRYGTAFDILVEPSTIPSAVVVARIHAVMRLAQRRLPSLRARL